MSKNHDFVSRSIDAKHPRYDKDEKRKGSPKLLDLKVESFNDKDPN